MFYLFPRGKLSAHSTVEKDMLKEFIMLCKKEDILNNKNHVDWLINIKGQEYYDWVKLVLENKEE